MIQVAIVVVLAVVPAVILLRRLVRHLRRQPTVVIPADSNVVYLDEWRVQRRHSGHATHAIHPSAWHASVAQSKALHPSSHHG